MPLTKIQDLNLHEINFLVAKLQGVRVEMYKGHVAERLEFSPEGPANAFSPNNDCMWRFYEPTHDYAITGPIMDKEGICVMYPSKESGEEKHSWAFYPDYDGSNDRHEFTGTWSSDAGMRTYVSKHFGDEVDMDNLPNIVRVAEVRIQGWNKPPETITDEDADAWVEQIVEVAAEFRDEAESKASAQFAGAEVLQSQFLRWK
jgi:hypothetical protein